ncbi:MAG: Gfo/Idh/MocA family oxidoreductase [Halobacteriaceae archaeon]
MSELRVGQVGFGARGESAAAGLAAAPSVDFRAVADLREERLAAAEAAHGVATYADAEAMFADADIEAVMVVTRADMHATVSIAAMEAGLDVLCEKPLAESVADAREMVAAARRTGRRGAVHFQNRYQPLYWTLRGVAPDLDPLQLLVTYQRGIFRERYLRPGYAYGILDGAIHRIDLANWVLGRTPTAVSASLAYGAYSPNEVIDSATIQIQYTGGESATVQASMGGPGVENVCQLVGERGNARQTGPGEVTVTDVAYTGETGNRQNVSDRTVGMERPPDYPEDPPGEAGPNGIALKEEFVRYARGEQPVGTASFEDGLDALLVAKAAVESEERSETVHLADLREEQSSV